MRRVLCLVAVLVVFIAGLARAADPPKILLVVEGEPGALYRRLQAELDELGFDVVAQQDASTSLAKRARRIGASAALRVPRSRAAVEVWVTDPASERSVLRQVFVSTAGAASDAVVATRAVELLRATFLEIDVAMPEVKPAPAGSGSASALRVVSATPSAAPSTPPAPSAAAPRPRSPKPAPRRAMSKRSPVRPTTFAGLGLLASASPGGVPADGHLALGLSTLLGAQWLVGGWVVAPSVLSKLEADQGSARVHVSLAFAELSYVAARRPVVPVTGVGFGGAWLAASGSASAPFTGVSDNAVTAFGFVRAGLRWSVSPTVAFTGDARLGAATPRVVVRFADDRIARWGQPLLLTSFAVEVGLD